MTTENPTHVMTLDPDPKVALAGLVHPQVDVVAVRQGAFHPNYRVALAALAHRISADEWVVFYAAQHAHHKVVLAALAHKCSDHGTTYYGAKHESPVVVDAALSHSCANKGTIILAERNEWYQKHLKKLKKLKGKK